MQNLDFITPQLATGGDLPYDDDEAYERLEAWVDLGITHIVDNREEWTDEDFVTELVPGLCYLQNGVDDAGQRMPDSWFDRGVSFVRDAFADPDAKVFVHCHMGINRGPSLAYAVLLAEGWDPIEAIDRIRAVRSIAAVGYAEDALAWHHRRTRMPAANRRRDRERLKAWRQDNWINVRRIVRRIRAAEVS